MFLLDTNVVSEMRKVLTGRANPKLRAWAEGVDADSLFLSVLTIQELEVGVLALDRQVLREFDGRVLPIDQAIALVGARLQVSDRRPVIDCLLAATALVHGFVMVTRNRKDFESTGVALCDPWA